MACARRIRRSPATLRDACAPEDDARGVALLTLDALAAFLHETLEAAAYPAEERGGVFRAPAADATSRPITRVGLALEPWPGLRAWATANALDALFLHRPWRLAPHVLDPRVGVLYSHLPFDEHLTTGLNLPLADALGLTSIEVLGRKLDRPLGMLGEIAARPACDVVDDVSRVWGGCEMVLVPDPAMVVRRIAVVGAMNDALVREAASRGVGLYVTGQLRQPARPAVAETGIAVHVVGHERSERWGLHALAGLLSGRWPALTVHVGGPDTNDPARPVRPRGVS